MNAPEKPANKLKGLVWLAIALFLGATLGTGLSKLAAAIPWSTEKKMASMLGGFSQLKACTGSASSGGPEALRKLIARIYPIEPKDSEFPVEISVVHGKTINAFASLGGQIYVYEGLLKQAESAEELAGVLAHEIEHVRHRHIIEGVLVKLSVMQTFSLIFGDGGTISPSIASALFNMQFSRGQEREADQGGLQRLSDAQVDNAGFKHFFERLKDLSSIPALLSDHPSSDDRIALIAQYRASDPKPVLSGEEWKSLRSLCD